MLKQRWSSHSPVRTARGQSGSKGVITQIQTGPFIYKEPSIYLYRLWEKGREVYLLGKSSAFETNEVYFYL